MSFHFGNPAPIIKNYRHMKNGRHVIFILTYKYNRFASSLCGNIKESDTTLLFFDGIYEP